MVGFKNIAQAFGILAGGAMEGYAKGAMADIMAKREAYMDQLKAAREQQATVEDRAFRSTEAEKGRGFQREMAGEEREWDKEKFGIEQAGAEKRLRLAASLRPKGGGGSGKPTALINEARQVLKGELGRDATDAEVSKYVRERTAKSGGSGGKTTLQERAVELRAKQFAKEAGRSEYNDEDWLKAHEAIGKKSDKEDLTASQYLSGISSRAESKLSPTNPTEYAKYIKDPGQARIDAKKEYDAELTALGITPPGGSRGARPASDSPQESVSEVEQPGVLDAPATSTQGDDTKGFEPPRGQGNKASPYMAETEAQAEWAVKNAPADSWVVFKGQLFQTEGKKK